MLQLVFINYEALNVWIKMVDTHIIFIAVNSVKEKKNLLKLALTGQLQVDYN